MHVIAHRGASVAERENTIAAFRAASEIGADAVELDVRRTADGVLVVHHDALVPTGDGSHPIDDLDLARLPTHVPTLGAALDACTGMWVNVEIKNDPREAGFDATDSIADETIAPDDLKEQLIHSLQKYVEVDEPEAETVPMIGGTAAIPAPSSSGDDSDVQFDKMSEEDLLRGLEGLVPPAQTEEEE